jgi:hypothetical protein
MKDPVTAIIKYLILDMRLFLPPQLKHARIGKREAVTRVDGLTMFAGLTKNRRITPARANPVICVVQTKWSPARRAACRHKRRVVE